LEYIWSEEDYRNFGSRISASLKETISRQPLQHDKGEPDKYFLGRYLKYIGFPNPSEPIQFEDVMKFVIGDLLVSQMMSLQKDQSEYFEIIPKLLNCKTKGTSEFVLNLTKTAAISADVKC